MRPKAICLEDLDARTRDQRYLRCVALVGRQPGLRLDEWGQALWQQPGDLELWVSGDDRLILYRSEGGAPAEVRRGARSLLAPEEKPVVLLDQDQLLVGGRHLRVHIHGQAPAVHAPAPLETRKRAGAAATLALGAALAACNPGKTGPATPPGGTETPPDIDVREAPPEAMPDTDFPDEVVDPAPPTIPELTDPPPPPLEPPPDIEVRIEPPSVVAPSPPPVGEPTPPPPPPPPVTTSPPEVEYPEEIEVRMTPPDVDAALDRPELDEGG